MKCLVFLLFLGLLSTTAATDLVLSPDLKSLNADLANCVPVDCHDAFVQDNTRGSKDVGISYDRERDVWQAKEDCLGWLGQPFKETLVDLFVGTSGNISISVLIPLDPLSKVLSYKVTPGRMVVIKRINCGSLVLKAPHMIMVSHELGTDSASSGADKPGFKSGPGLLGVYMEFAHILVAVAVLGFFY